MKPFTLFIVLLQVLFIGLKLSHDISWSWFWVLTPLWIAVAIYIFVFSVAVLYYTFKKLDKKGF